MSTNFVEIIECTEKSKLEKLCKTSAITMSEFVDFIVVCKAGLTRLNHTMHFVDFVPLDVEEKENDWEILNSDSAARATKDGQKALQRLFKSHGLRQYRVGHMFFSKEFSHPIREWHFVFFEMNELKERDNHWVMGPHVHLTNYLWPNLYCQKVWNEFVSTKAFPKSKVHLSCIDENQRNA